MPKRAAPLTDIQPRTAKPRDKPYKLTDGGGLYLLVNTGGAKYWRIDYRYAGARKKRAAYNGRMTGHGFRSLAMGVIKERLGYRHEVVDR